MPAISSTSAKYVRSDGLNNGPVHTPSRAQGKCKPIAGLRQPRRGGYGCAMTGEQEAPPPYSTATVSVLRLPGGVERDDRVAIEITVDHIMGRA